MQEAVAVEVGNRHRRCRRRRRRRRQVVDVRRQVEGHLAPAPDSPERALAAEVVHARLAEPLSAANRFLAGLGGARMRQTPADVDAANGRFDEWQNGVIDRNL